MTIRDTTPTDASIAREVDKVLDAWRARVLNILLIVVTVIMLPPVLAVWIGPLIPLPPPLPAISLIVYLALLLATVRPRWSLRRRAGILLAGLAIMGAIQLVVAQLAGSGRIALLLMPLLALLLVGPRAGWVAAALSAAVFTLVPLLLLSGLPAGWPALEGTEAPIRYWVLQGIFWLGALLPLMILFTRFQVLQRRTMIAERIVRRQLEAESADRRRLEAEVARIGDAERQRLGVELHDGLCQHLTAALLNCSALENRRQAAGDPDAASIGRIRLALEESIGLAHDVARGLCPVDMDPDSLPPALERLCREVCDDHGIDCRLQAPRDLAVRNAEHALHLYRIAREAVINAVKHARCSRIAIRLEREGDDLVLQVSDDGRPSNPAAETADGLGMRIMSYRAGLIGGRLLVTAEDGGGLRVTCRVPASGTEARG